MLIYSDALAKALATHKFDDGDGTAYRTCTDCGLKAPKRANFGGYEVAKVPNCPGKQEDKTND